MGRVLSYMLFVCLGLNLESVSTCTECGGGDKAVYEQRHEKINILHMQKQRLCSSSK